ncbi:MAG: hypothetical protein ABEN55_03000 [Bradymonadaceae bacterium]
MMRGSLPTIENVSRLAAVALAAIVGLAVGCGGDTTSAPGVDIEMFATP